MWLKHTGILSAFIAICLLITTAESIDCDVHPEPIDFSLCCSLPEIIGEDIKEKCRDLLPPPPPPLPLTSSEEDTSDGDDDDSDSSRPRPRPRPHPRPHPHPHPHPHHACFMSCLINETGILMDGKLHAANLKDYLSSRMDDTPEMIPIMEQSFQTCQKKNEEFRNKIMEHIKRHPAKQAFTSDRMMRPHCSPAGGMLIGCAFMESFKNCPTAAWNNTETCNNMRDFMMNCKPQHGHFKKLVADSNENEMQA